MTINDQLTEEYSQSSLPVSVRNVRGVSTCRLMNELLSKTNLKFFIKIGDRPYQVLWTAPVASPNIRVYIAGAGSITIPWYTQFIMYLGSNTNEYANVLKKGTELNMNVGS